MRFVPLKPAEQQAIQMLHRNRDLLVAPKGTRRIPELDILTENTAEDQLPDPARECARLILAQIGDLQAKIKAIEKTIVARHKSNEMSQRLATIPGAGIIAVTATVATLIDTGFSSPAGTSRPDSDWCHGGGALCTQQVGSGRMGQRLAGAAAGRVVTVAIANKLARISWAITSKGGTFRERSYGIARAWAILEYEEISLTRSISS
jgi:transposase